MHFHTCFNNQSFHGYKASILKSGICKYTRRTQDNKLLWCVMEMAHFQTLVKDDPKVKGIISNLISRLKILLMEDVHVLEAERCARCIVILSEYEDDRNKRHLLMDFCQVLVGSKKGRLTSYYNKWYQTHPLLSGDVVGLKLNEVIKFKKNGDTDEFLNLGENMIRFLKEGDERFLGVYNLMVNCGDQGIRYSRKSAVYLWWEILEYLVQNDKTIKTIWLMAFHEFKRLGLKERFHFGVWIGIVYWKRKDLLKMNGEIKTFSAKDCDLFYRDMAYMTMDDYVVNDFHVNKKHGLAKFATDGAFVPDEDLSAFDNGSMYKHYYIEDKVNTVPPHKKKKKKKKKTNNSNVPEVKMIRYREKEYYVTTEEEPNFISWSQFSDVHILEDGVCGGKVCCISVLYEGHKYILKEMGKSMNYGKDYLLCDRCKKLFGLKDMNMKRISSDKGQMKIDKKKKSYVNNVEIGEKKCIYCMMDYWDNVGDLGKNKNFLLDETVVKECLKIRLVDGIFRSSDNILRNILVNSSGQLLSIDEGDIFGKRANIFNKNDWCKDNCSSVLFKEVIAEITDKRHLKIVQITKEMTKLDVYNSEFFHRFMKFEEIVEEELS